MKKLLFTIISSSLVASTIYASNTIIINDYLENPYNFAKDYKAITLYDGRNIDLNKDVQNLYMFNTKVDYLELYNGEVVDRTDIQSFESVKKPTLPVIINEALFLSKLGVDGGG